MWPLRGVHCMARCNWMMVPFNSSIWQIYEVTDGWHISWKTVHSHLSFQLNFCPSMFFCIFVFLWFALTNDWDVIYFLLFKHVSPFKPLTIYDSIFSLIPSETILYISPPILVKSVLKKTVEIFGKNRTSLWDVIFHWVFPSFSPNLAITWRGLAF